MTEEKRESSSKITRREFLKRAGTEGLAVSAALSLVCATLETLIRRTATSSAQEIPPTPTLPDQLEETSSTDGPFHFSEEVTYEQRELITKTTSQTLSWLNPKMETPLEGVSVYAYDDAEQLVDLYLSRTDFPEGVKAQERQNLLRGATAWAGRQNDIYIFTKAPGWISASPIVAGPVREGQMHTIAHELFHLLQMKFGAHNNLFPAWLWEGSAHYIAARFLGENDLYSFEDITSRHTQEASKMYEPMRLLENWQDFSRAGSPYADEYSLAFLATKHLLEDFPEGGVKELSNFWELVGKPLPWTNAFQEVFGKTPQEYYSSFENWRTNGFKTRDN